MVELGIGALVAVVVGAGAYMYGHAKGVAEGFVEGRRRPRRARVAGGNDRVEAPSNEPQTGYGNSEL